MNQVTITPKYALGRIVETTTSEFGCIKKVGAIASWDDKVNGAVEITYFISNGAGPWSSYKEREIKRVVALE